MVENKEICSGSRWTIKSVKGSYDFKIGGYSGREAGKGIASDTFKVSKYKWRIVFYPNPRAASVHIVLASHGSDVRVMYELTLLDQSGKGQHLVQRCIRPYTLKSRGSKCGEVFFIRRESLEASDYVKDDCLLVHCQVGVVLHFTTFTPASDMSQNLNYLLETQTGCDINLRFGDKSFKAHKVILAAGSPVFKSLFFGLLGNHNMDEVEFKEVEPSIFKAMLRFIYGDTLPDLQELTGLLPSTSTDIIEQLLAAADRFGVDRLKLLIEAKLGDELNIDTVATTLALADKYYCSELKSICKKFASENLEGGAC